MKKMKITALLLALIMLLQPVLVSADAAGVSLEDYMGFINNAQNYGLIDSAYEYYVQQLEGKTVAERYQTLKSWHEGLLGDLFYENFIAYYEKAHAGENLICVCGAPCEYGNIAHTNPACQWYFGNLPLTEQYDILSGLEGDTKAAYEAVLPADTLDKLHRYNVRTLTAAADDVSVKINVPTDAFAEDYILSASSASLSDEAAAAVAAAVEEGLGSEVLGAFDISFLSVATDDKLQPGAPVGLSFTVDMPAMEDAENAPEVRLVVYHITEKDGALVAEPVGEKAADLTAAQQTVEVEAKAFSMYVVGAVGDTTGTEIENLYFMEPGETVVIYSSINSGNATWTYTSNDAFTVTPDAESNNTKYVTVTCIGEGTITLRYRGSGWFAQTDEITVRSIPYNVTFDANGGNGNDYVMKVRGSTFVFPNPSDIGITAPEGMEFAGWCVAANGKDDTYSAGLENSISGDLMFYAQWYDPDATGATEAYFYIRLDGIIPYEPNTTYGTNNYYPEYNYWGDNSAYHSTNNDGYLRSPVSITNNLTAVKNNLAVSPTLTEIDAMLGNTTVQVNGEYVQFDPTKHDVVWYAIKYDCGDKPVSHFHIDGIVVAKNQYIVTYHPNKGSSNVPGGGAYYPDDTVTVAFDKIPTRAGYEFLGWDTDENATTPMYTQDGNKTFTMPSKNVDLYAIWRPLNSTPYYVEHYRVTTDGELIDKETYYERKEHFGETDSTVTITAANVDDYAIDIPGFELDLAYAPAGSTTDLTGKVVAEASDGNEYPLVLKLYYKQSTGDLVINKTVQDSTFTSEDEERTFNFTVNNVTKSITVNGANKTGTVTFTGLVAGDYTVTESHDGQYATTMGNTNGTTTTVTINAGQTTTLDVVNTANAKMDVEVTKTWVDNNNNLGKRPPTITVYLMNGSTQVQSAEITGDKQAATWTHTFTGVDKFDANGQEITYTVAEGAVNYYTGTPSGLKITNSITVGSLIVTKQVVDDANVYEGETRTFTFTVTGPDNYEYAQNLTFTNKGTQSLTFGNLTPGEYTVTESAYNGYDTTVDGVSGLTKKVLVVAGDTTTVAYVNTVMTKPVKVTKVWQDNGNELGVRPSEVTVELIASNTAYNKTITLKPADTDTENTAEFWEGTIANVELYDVNGTELTYTVKEVTTNSNYATTYAPVDCKVDMTATTPSVTITNSIKLGSLTITKRVVDPSGKYADDLTFEFTVTGAHYNKKHTVTVKKDNGYTHSVTIPQLLIGEYTVTETVPGNFTVKENNLTATVAENATATVAFENTVKTFTLTANKTWAEVNGDKSHRPASVTYTLATGDAQFDDTVTIPAETDDTWTAEKANLPVYTEDGTLITYTATETLDKASADFYVLDATSGYDVTATAEDATVSMTNVLKVGNLVIVKVIEDPSATYNASQEFEFTVNGVTKTVTVAARETEGTTTFENLTIGTYAVTETVPRNYDLTSVTVGNTAIENGGNVAITYDNAPQTTTVTFTNTVKTVDIPVTKEWVDESNKLGTRPDSIDLTLTGKVGETAVVTKTQQLTAANAVSGNADKWEFTFVKLPVYTADGDLITYMVDEAPVEDYKKSINGFEITNTLLSTTLTITKAGCDETLDAGQSFLFRVTSTNGVDLIIAINGNGSETISGLLVGDEVTVTEIEGWSWRYTGTAQTITLEDGENTVTITNTRDNPYWLDGDCYAENNFAKQGN